MIKQDIIIKKIIHDICNMRPLTKEQLVIIKYLSDSEKMEIIKSLNKTMEALNEFILNLNDS